jgi:ribose-phosphate pyrophosphokinase
MKTLNLTDIDKSDIKYQIQKFPDGQSNIVLKSSVNMDIPIDNGLSLSNLNRYPVQIKSRLNNWLDLELIVCAVASLRLLKVKEIHLFVPYILGARSDRKFEHGGNRYIKDVIAPVINSLNFESVTCIDPHSYVLENCINNFQSKTNLELVSSALEDLYVGKVDFSKRQSSHITFNTNDCVFISPDAGASHKIFKLAEQIGYKGDIITCSKERDKDGKIIGTNVPLKEPFYSKDFIIIDDICDGGATFINIAKKIETTINKMDRDYKPKIYLIVTHGIFSKGFDELSKYFDGIYCTNSYQDYAFHSHTFVKQLNVF